MGDVGRVLKGQKCGRVISKAGNFARLPMQAELVPPNYAGGRASSKASIIAVFTAVSLGTNYVLAAVPNVKVMDAVVFIAAFLFGLDVGLGTAFFSRLIYGYVNPWGQVGLDLLVFLIIGESFYALAGSLLRRGLSVKGLTVEKGTYAGWGIVFGVTGLVSTFAYDVLTNFASYVFTTTSLFNALIIGMATGAPFAIIHEVSNLVFFGTVAPVTIISAKRFLVVSRRI
jgi:hypothetical protein